MSTRSRRAIFTNLDGCNVGVLRNVLVLVKCILGELSFLLLDGQLHQQDHHRLEGRDWNISRTLVGDVLVEQGQGRGGLVDSDELMGAFEHIFGLLMRRRRLYSWSRLAKRWPF